MSAPGIAPAPAAPLLADADLPRGARVLVRVDWNVPMSGGRVLDAARVHTTLPTLDLLADRGAEITVMTHLGYPGGRQAPGLGTTMLAPLLGERAAAVCLAENLRFSPGEEAADPGFAAALAEGHDLFVNDAFSCMHRPHASIVGVPRFLDGYLGPTAEAELRRAREWSREPPARRGLVVGGGKVADKLPLLARLAGQAEVVAVGGLTAVPLLVAAGRADPALADPAHIAIAERVLSARPDLLLPRNLVARGGAGPRRTAALAAGDTCLDVDPASAAEFGAALRGCAAVLVAGPLGRYERTPYDQGTDTLLRALGAEQVVLACGGDTAAAVRLLGAADRLGPPSTAGGAMLTYLAHGDLIGLAALRARSTHRLPESERPR